MLDHSFYFRILVSLLSFLSLSSSFASHLYSQHSGSLNMSLNTNNYLNLFGFITNVVVTFGASSIFGFPDNAEVGVSGMCQNILLFLLSFSHIFIVLYHLPVKRKIPEYYNTSWRSLFNLGNYFHCTGYFCF